MKSMGAIDHLRDAELSLATAQYRAFAGKMPAFYLSIAASKLATCYAFYGLAPRWMCWGLASFASLICIRRATWWMRHRNDPISADAADRKLKQATTLLVAVSIFFISCDIVFYRYGNIDERMLLQFILLSSAMCSFFCLMHLRIAALITAAVILVPFLSLLLYRGTSSSWAVACNLVVVAAAMVVVMQSYAREFEHLVESKKSVVRQRAETERLSNQNLRLANVDMLTELPNRRCFFADLNMKRRQAIANQRDVGVGILDLDGFKPINDLYGHGIGDRMLQSVADRLEEIAGDHATVYRIGGDEFAFIVEAPESDRVLIGLGERIIAAVCQPVKLGDLVASVGCSIGFATWSDSSETPDMLYERADYALYHAKRTGRARVVMFSQEHELTIKARGVVENALRNADLNRELDLAFQPIVRLTTGQTTAFECLARWRSPTLGDVPPGTFIVVAEQAGLMTSLTPILLRKALSVAVTWPDPLRMSFNLSAHDIASAERIQVLLDIVEASEFDPRRIDMELTETALACNFELAFSHMMLLKEVGIRISLDDFGTGYSSISHIHALPLDKIKIDRSFVKGLGIDVNSLKIVKSLSALCRDMGLDCTVEGVETAAQVDHLSALGCDLIQGYYVAKPMLADQIESYLQQALPVPLDGEQRTAA